MSFVITVEFEIHADQMDRFLTLMIDNASASRHREPGCRQFDVCTDPQRPQHVFLYEVYDSAAAFDAHVSSEHFREFDAASAPLVASKRVQRLQRVDPA